MLTKKEILAILFAGVIATGTTIAAVNTEPIKTEKENKMKKIMIIAVLGFLLLNGCSSDGFHGDCTQQVTPQTEQDTQVTPQTEQDTPVIIHECQPEDVTTVHNDELGATEVYCDTNLLTSIPDAEDEPCDIIVTADQEGQTIIYRNGEEVFVINPVYIPCELVTQIDENGSTSIVCDETGEVVTVINPHIVEHNTTVIVDNTVRSCPVTFQVFMDSSLDGEPQQDEIERAKRLINHNHGIKIVINDVETGTRQVEAYANRKALIIVPMQENTPYQLVVNRTENGNVIDDGGSFADISARGHLRQAYQPNVTAEDPFTINCDDDNTYFLRYDPLVDENGDVIL